MITGHEHSHEHESGHGPRWLCRLHALLGMALTFFLLAHLGIGLIAVDAPAYVAAVSRLRRWHAAPVLALMAAAVLVQLATGIARLVRNPRLHGGCSHGALGPAWQRATALLVAAFVIAHLGRAWTLGPSREGTALTRGLEVMTFAATSGFTRIALAGFTLLGTWALALHVASGWYGTTRFLPVSLENRSRRVWGGWCVALGATLGAAGSAASMALILRSGP